MLYQRRGHFRDQQRAAKFKVFFVNALFVW